jgi:hypothetical protein
MADTLITNPRTNGHQQARPGEQVICNWVSGLLADAKAARSRLLKDSDWGEWLQTYWGTYWPESLPSYKSPINVNETKLLILNELSDLTDNTPQVYVSYDPRTGKRDEQVEKAIQAYWRAEFIDMTLLEAYADAAIWPCGFLEVLWEPWRENGQGEIVVRPRHPQSVYPDPRATSDEDWRYVIWEDILDVVEVRQKWPDTGRRVLPDAATHGSTQQGLSPGDPFGAGRGEGITSALYPYGGPVPTGGAESGVRVWTCYTRDDRLENEVEEYTDMAGKKQLRQVSRYKYPQGRLIQCTSSVVLYDDVNPYWGNCFPLIQVKLQPSIHSFWPRQSLVSEVQELQRGSDKNESLVLENALRMNKGLWIADSTSGINPKTFADVPGQVVLKRQGTDVHAQYPPPMPPEMIQQGARLRANMREVLGFQPSRQGQQGQGNVSAELTETEISQSMGLTRLRSRLLLKSVSRLVQMIFMRMAQFYTTPRLLPFVQDEEWQPIQWQPLLEWSRYAVHVDPNSYQVQSKTMLKRLFLALARLNRIPNEDLLRMLEVPGYKEIAAKLQQEMAMQAAAKGQKGRR